MAISSIAGHLATQKQVHPYTQDQWSISLVAARPVANLTSYGQCLASNWNSEAWRQRHCSVGTGRVLLTSGSS